MALHSNEGRYIGLYKPGAQKAFESHHKMYIML